MAVVLIKFFFFFLLALDLFKSCCCQLSKFKAYYNCVNYKYLVDVNKNIYYILSI